MPCAYCGKDVNVVPRKFRSADDGMVDVQVDVCKRCFEKYKLSLFDACDQCNVVQDLRFNSFQVICGKMLCVSCKDALIAKK